MCSQRLKEKVMIAAQGHEKSIAAKVKVSDNASLPSSVCNFCFIEH